MPLSISTKVSEKFSSFIFNTRSRDQNTAKGEKLRSHSSESASSLKTLPPSLLALSLSLISGCNSPSSQEIARNETAPTPITQPSDPGPIWKETFYSGKWFQLRLKTLDENTLVRKEREYASSTLSESSLSTPNGYRFYSVIGKKQDSALYIIPKILIQSEVFGGRVKADTLQGITTVKFPVALVDYSKSKLVTGYSEAPVPPSYVLSASEKNKLGQEATRAQSGSDCPERIEFRQGNESLTLSLTFPEGGCPRNQFFEIVATGRSSEIRSWFEDKIPEGNVALFAVFRPKKSFLSKVVNLDFNSGLLFEKLYSTLVEGGLSRETPSIESQSWGVSELHEKLKRFLIQELNSTEFPGLADADLSVFIDEILGNFFVKTNEKCPSYPNICMKLKSKPPTTNVFSLVFSGNKEFPIIGSPIEVSAPIHDLSQDVSLFTIEAEKTDDLHAPAEGRVGGGIRQVSPGDLVELELSEITGHHRQYSAAMFREEKSNLNNIVCTSWGEIPTIEVTDYNNCLEYNQECREWRTCNAWADPCVEWEAHCCWGMGRGGDMCAFIRSKDPNNFNGKRDCTGHRCIATTHVCTAPVRDCIQWVNTSCKRFGTRRVPNGEAPCQSKENHWMKHHDLADPLPMQNRKVDFASVDTAALISGLKLQFTSFRWGPDGEPVFAKTSCSLSQLMPEMKQIQNKLLIRFRLENHPENHCEPFNQENTNLGFEPEIAIVNQIAAPEQIPCGFVEDFWDGRHVFTCPELNQRSEKEIFRTYYPRMDMAGKFRLPGVRFISE